MTALLQRAFEEAGKLSAEDQDAVACRLLAELEDEWGWNLRFESTTGDQWDRIVAEARSEIEAGGTRPLDEVFPDEGSSR